MLIETTQANFSAQAWNSFARHEGLIVPVLQMEVDGGDVRAVVLVLRW